MGVGQWAGWSEPDSWSGWVREEEESEQVQLQGTRTLMAHMSPFHMPLYTCAAQGTRRPVKPIHPLRVPP